MPPTPQHTTPNPHLHQRLLDTQGQVWISLLWGHCSFLLGPGAQKVLFVPSKILFPQSCVSSGGSMVGLMASSSKRVYAIPRSAAPTALSNKIKPWDTPCRATQDGWVMVESSDKTWSTGEGEWQTSILALRSPWTIWKGKKIGHWKMNSPHWQVPNMLLEISGEITPERMTRWSHSKNNTQLWMWLVMEVKSDTVKSNTA